MQTGHHDLQDANLSEDVTVDNMITQNTQQGLHAQYAVWQLAKKKKKEQSYKTAVETSIQTHSQYAEFCKDSTTSF